MRSDTPQKAKVRPLSLDHDHRRILSSFIQFTEVLAERHASVEQIPPSVKSGSTVIDASVQKDELEEIDTEHEFVQLDFIFDYPDSRFDI